MEKLKFIADIRNQFENPEKVQIDFETIFRNIDDYDSLTGMSILVILKDEYGVDIPDDQYRRLATVEDLYNYVRDKQP